MLEKIDAEILHAATVADALDYVNEGLDFAMLDVVLGPSGETSLPIAQLLLRNNVPFCFISSSLDQLPAQLDTVPRISKPFRPHEVENLVPVHV
ncbi:MAG TPA: hypothetical protein ENH55_06350 [Aurantimonas coralicida]|uniref:Response regulator n=1 Tax=Aurantimonas coralicida TaxID=182270 RepID=A0A9C9NFC2_9HYPH|nr:hypothetical protein [Aurantimonas coralicida]HEU00159.1 hypothetical protein [Aurantimonas coralicida]